MNILIAEDDPNISTIAIMALEHIGGHKVDLVTDGEAALSKALSGNYELILLDQMMPKMTGLEVCQSYKKSCKTPVPIIFLSAKTHGDIIEQFTTHGNGFIQKPFDPTSLCDEIQKIFDSSTGGQ